MSDELMAKITAQADEARAAWQQLKAENKRDDALDIWDEHSWQAGFVRGAASRGSTATLARQHEVGLMHAERMGVEVPIYPDIASWVNVILVAELLDEEIEERKKDATDGAVQILTIIARMLRHALNTCRDCGSPEGHHYTGCPALAEPRPSTPGGAD